jgi:CspA family cold shock protein
MYTGTVKYFTTDKGYGFIHADHDHLDYFAHARDIVCAPQGPRILIKGQRVQFDIEPSRRDPEKLSAVNVQVTP